MKLLCSTGAFITRRNERDYTLIPKIAPLLCGDGLEFMMYDSWFGHEDEVAAALAGLPIPVMHAEKQIGERIGRGEPGDEGEAFAHFRRNCTLARRIGVETLVLHLWNGLPSDRHFQRNLNAFGELWRMADAQGLLLTVENVVCNAGEPMAHFCELRERYPQVAFTYDTKMAAFHGEGDWIVQLQWAWLWEEHRIRHLHVNDFGGVVGDWSNLRVLHPGEGHVSFAPLQRCLRQYNYTGFATSEAGAVREDGTVDTERLNQTLRFYDHLLNG